MRIVSTRQGGRLMHGPHVLSEVRRTPGPTHSVFDLLAACATAFGRGDMLAMLGFAAGGMVAPLRALGWTHTINAVDLCLDGLTLFDACVGDWTGHVRIAQADAVDWLERHGLWDIVVEDLSIQIPGDVTKPQVSLDILPKLVASRLEPKGVAVFNAFSVDGLSDRALLEKIGAPYACARVVRLDSFTNLVVVAGETLPTAREMSRVLRTTLGALGSSLADEVRVRTLRG